MAQCHYCERPANTRDHIVPRTLTRKFFPFGTPHWAPTNIVPACVRCNQLKGDKRSDCKCATCELAWETYGPPAEREVSTVRVRLLAARSDRLL